MTAARDSGEPYLGGWSEELARLRSVNAALLAASEMMLTWVDSDTPGRDARAVLAMRAAVRQARGEG